MRTGIIFAAAITLTTMLAAHAHAANNLLFILDSSGSMWGKLEGTAKMETAKKALSKLVGDLPKDTKVGLMAYGHRLGRKDPGACEDIEILMSVGKATPDDVVSWLEKINPKGKTPIAGSLRQTPAAFAGLEKSNNNIVLISDGIETCDGDPCAVAGALAKSNINVRVHVVGFDISDKDRAQLECIAKLGNGKYFPANSTKGFTKAVTEAVKVAQAQTKPEPRPAPQPSKPVLYFEDNFDGEDLAEHWEVLNPDPDSYIVENGFLNVLTAKELTLYDQSDKLPNLYRLNKPLPEGDWTATFRLKPTITTFREMYAIALYTDKNNFLAASAWSSIHGWSGTAKVNFYATKYSKGIATQFGANLISSQKFGHKTFPAKSKEYVDWTSKHVKGILLRIRKKGRSYFVAAKVEGDPVSKDGQPAKWVELDKLTSLRSPGKFLVLSIGQAKFDKSYNHLKGGETLVNVDWIKIETEK